MCKCVICNKECSDQTTCSIECDKEFNLLMEEIEELDDDEKEMCFDMTTS